MLSSARMTTVLTLLSGRPPLLSQAQQANGLFSQGPVKLHFLTYRAVINGARRVLAASLVSQGSQNIFCQRPCMVLCVTLQQAFFMRECSHVKGSSTAKSATQAHGRKYREGLNLFIYSLDSSLFTEVLVNSYRQSKSPPAALRSLQHFASHIQGQGAYPMPSFAIKLAAFVLQPFFFSFVHLPFPSELLDITIKCTFMLSFKYRLFYS